MREIPITYMYIITPSSTQMILSYSDINRIYIALQSVLFHFFFFLEKLPPLTTLWQCYALFCWVVTFYSYGR